MDSRSVSDHFDRLAGEYDSWKERASYYYDLLTAVYREIIPEGASVLEVGCGTGTLLARMRPSRGVGIDISGRMVAVASRKYPRYRFLVGDAANLSLGETFDYVMVPDVVEHLPDVPAAFSSLSSACDDRTTLVVTCANPLWAPVLHAAERLGLKMPEGDHRWLQKDEILRISLESGFRLEAFRGRILLPKRVPLLAGLLNRMPRRIPRLSALTLIHVYVFRKASPQGPRTARTG